jgi:RNA-binding protein
MDIKVLEDRVADMSRGQVVATASPTRTGKQRRHLRALGHKLKATAHIGQSGLTDALATQLGELLDRHELIKVKVNDGADCTVSAAAVWTHDTLKADVPQIIGRTILCYRPHPEKPVIKLPKPVEE